MTIDYIYNRVKTESEKGRTLLFDIWIDTMKVADKEQLDAEELREKLESYPDAGFIRVRMYWLYGANTRRFLEQMTAKIERPATMSGTQPQDDEDDDQEPPAPPRRATSQQPTMMLDSNNPLSWMLQERSAQLQAIRDKYEALKAKAEKLRDEKEMLEREIIKKDHAIENLTTQAEEGTGLNGFLSNNPGIAEKAIEVLGPALTGLIGGSMQAASAYGDTATDVADWIQTQPEEDQERIRVIMTEIARRAQANPEFLEVLKNQMQKTQKPTQHQNGTLKVS